MKYKRIVAVGDIHGDYNQLVSILRNAKLINKKNKWIGYDSILVQMGDLVDRGSDTKKVLDLMIDIREQAKRKGGKVNVILGNHETNIMQGYYLYTYICDLMEFGTLEDRKKAFSLNHKYGNFLRKEMEPVIIIDDILFTHGGLIKKYAELGIDNLNKKIHNILMETPYDFSLYDKGENSTEPIVSDLMMDDGPTWSRRYTSFKPDEEKEACDELSEVLKMTNTTRMVVGHTVQKDGLIKTKCDNKLVVVDIGITASYGSHFGYLEINRKNNEFWAIYNKTMNN
ncbi:Metallo-dependent phosphatase [Anaeromyces robustus]|uniref:Metallo-dependent phosphatase n=1 Tax=Anaeromyces robustus TaxID=1754192 RepID=A0A1Y1WGH4_9FUNG|nr:Metallo-dependent phosphatase [Anaeromyces robustus]|eukprot:ORX72572.1 Metallo-dependent phosphatase [Anaeromyces robustus]